MGRADYLCIVLLASCFPCKANINIIRGEYVNQFFGSDKIEYVFQRPAFIDKPITGALFLAHGCSHSATDWWPRSESCPTCLGLPVEASIVKEAVRRNYFVFAMSSSDRLVKCWSENDLTKATKLINFVYKNFLSADFSIPLYLLGGSSGGAFVAMLASAQSTTPLVSAVCVQIMGVHDLSTTLPPALFVLMVKDVHMMNHMKNIFREHKLESKGAFKHKLISISELKIGPTFFAEHNEVLSIADSAALYQAFLSNGIISSTTQFLLKDPRDLESIWREVKQWQYETYYIIIHVVIMPIIRI
jgi:hypothetical protein